MTMKFKKMKWWRVPILHSAPPAAGPAALAKLAMDCPIPLTAPRYWSVTEWFTWIITAVNAKQEVTDFQHVASSSKGHMIIRVVLSDTCCATRDLLRTAIKGRAMAAGSTAIVPTSNIQRLDRRAITGRAVLVNMSITMPEMDNRAPICIESNPMPPSATSTFKNRGIVSSSSMEAAASKP
eukprot:CAMPEP_0173303926 /NCGR_PEP_ID=MMETSP1143-20121109/19160_1 /TAXON_ID=483371 /ORGANISM="non described non described, Strain CCMP2298" /LENGTH=180 /DNA_ID=CAMNT_0014244689 /DNA_START=249 /DNA_END=791 /DNA_ORIENTATION=+